MLENFIPQLITDLELPVKSLESKVQGVYTLPMNKDNSIEITDLMTGFILKCQIAPFPKKQEELFVSKVMLANLFGQGTKEAVLSLSRENNFLTLNRLIDRPVNYKEFIETLEDFINVLNFWKEEVILFS